MHLPPALAVDTAGAVNQEHVPERERLGLKFLWLELTNRCNLQCVHCYTESGPGSGQRDLLTTEDYESVMNQAYALGCRMIQFIGGEPQLNRDFLQLLNKANEIGFEFIEVFTNLTRLSEDTLRYSAQHGIRFATSIYSHDPAVHDVITTVRSSTPARDRYIDVSHLMVGVGRRSEFGNWIVVTGGRLGLISLRWRQRQRVRS